MGISNENEKGKGRNIYHILDPDEGKYEEEVIILRETYKKEKKGKMVDRRQ